MKEIELKCTECDYQWSYHGKKLEMIEEGKRVYVSCPVCRANIKIN